MKRFLATLLVFILVLSSCGGGDNAGETTPEEAATSPATEETTSIPTPPIIEDEPEKEIPVIINELCAKNKECYVTADGESPDWIELYNRSNEAIDLSGYGITDNRSQPFKYTFESVVLAPGECILLFAVGEEAEIEGEISLPFSLSADGEVIVLTAPDELFDRVEYPALGDDETYGRRSESDGRLVYLTATPGAINSTGEEIIKVSAPLFSHKSGFYSEDFELSITADEGCKIYYTVDGSTPNSSSKLYTGAISLDDPSSNPNVFSAISGTAHWTHIPTGPVDKINIVRAVAIDEEGKVSREVHASYILLPPEKLQMYENVAIASIYTDSDNLFGYENGIYMLGKAYDDYLKYSYDPEIPSYFQPANYFLSGRDAERVAQIEFFDEDGSFGFSQTVGIRISGNASRSNRQKSLRVYARSEYGNNEFDYELFEGFDNADSFLLRNGGNDSDGSKARDVLLQSIMADRSFTTSQWKPCALFLNGEYWGVYLLMQRYDNDYFAEAFDVDKDEVIMIKNLGVSEGSEEDKNLYRKMRDFTSSHDMTIDENYQKLCEMVDMQNYIEYVCANIIINNVDWPGNNTALWRTRTVDESRPYADGKWRWASFDTEYSMSIYGQTDKSGYANNTYERLMRHGIIFPYVYKNKDFAKQFCDTMKDMLENDFADENIKSHLESIKARLRDQMALNHFRHATSKDFEAEVHKIREFWFFRPKYVIQHTEALFGVTLDVKRD